MKTRFLITSICLFVVGSMSNAYAGAGAAGHEHSAYKFGQPGNPKKPSRVIEIKMTDSNGEMKFSPKAIEIKKGEQIKFKIQNIGELDHEVVIDTLPNNLKHAEEMMKIRIWNMTIRMRSVLDQKSPEKLCGSLTSLEHSTSRA